MGLRLLKCREFYWTWKEKEPFRYRDRRDCLRTTASCCRDCVVLRTASIQRCWKEEWNVRASLAAKKD